MAKVAWDTKAALADLARLRQALQSPQPGGPAARAALKVGAQCLNDAVQEIPSVPKLTGALRESGNVELTLETGRVVADVGFNKPYAAAMHEGVWASGPLAGVHIHHWTTLGTGPKYLESKMRTHGAEYVRIFGQIVAREVGL